MKNPNPQVGSKQALNSSNHASTPHNIGKFADHERRDTQAVSNNALPIESKPSEHSNFGPAKSKMTSKHQDDSLAPKVSIDIPDDTSKQSPWRLLQQTEVVDFSSLSQQQDASDICKLNQSQKQAVASSSTKARYSHDAQYSKLESRIEEAKQAPQRAGKWEGGGQSRRSLKEKKIANQQEQRTHESNEQIVFKQSQSAKLSKNKIRQDKMRKSEVKGNLQEKNSADSQCELQDSEIFSTFTKTHHRTGKPVVIKHLYLQDFKRIECPKKNSPHNHKSCYYFHSIKDKRRDDDFYTPELCKFAETERCPKKDRCRRAHNRVERLYHKDKYKTKFCHCHPSRIQQCEYGDYCSFAHSVEDIKVRLVHHLQPQNQDFDFYIFFFKTEWCPYNHDHNKAQCVYAHNFQDFRRKPNLFRYDSELCEDWQSGTFITCYEEGCKRLEKCTFSHGWKEQQFHPLIYKTQPCEEPKCFKGFECPFYHSQKDKRVVDNSQQDQDKLFIPKERQIKCAQQPNMMELYFENNLNHLKEQELAQPKNGGQQREVYELREPQFEAAKQEEPEFEITRFSSRKATGENLHFEQHEREIGQNELHESQIKTKLPPTMKRLLSEEVPQYALRSPAASQATPTHPPIHSSLHLDAKPFNPAATSQQQQANRTHQSHQKISDMQMNYQLYMQPQTFSQQMQNAQMMYGPPGLPHPSQQILNRPPPSFYPQYQSPCQQTLHPQTYIPSPMPYQQSYQCMHQDCHAQQNMMNQYMSHQYAQTPCMSSRPLPQAYPLQKTYSNSWLTEKKPTFHAQDNLFASGSTKAYESADLSELKPLRMQAQRKMTHDHKQTPLGMAVVAVEQRRQLSQNSDSDSLGSQEETPVYISQAQREQLIPRSCPLTHQRQSPNLMDCHYQEKLQMLADSYRKKKYNFNDIEEEEPEQEMQKSVGYNYMARTLLFDDEGENKENEGQALLYTNPVMNLFKTSFSQINSQQPDSQGSFRDLQSGKPAQSVTPPPMNVTQPLLSKERVPVDLSKAEDTRNHTLL